MPDANAKLDVGNQRYLEAAEGWLGLGNWMEANSGLENISARLRANSEVLRVRYGVYALAKKWKDAAQIAQAISQLAPDEVFGWIHHAYALHET